MKLPLLFSSFLKENIEYLSDIQIPRTIRCKRAISIDDLKNDLNTESIIEIPWFSGLYQLDSSVKLSNSKLYSQGLIYGIDVTSAIAVYALSINSNDHVLDLCCAPGAKTCYISDLQGNEGYGTVTGVDISKERLQVCKRLTKKYKLEKCRLFHADGSTFDVYAPSRVGSRVLYESRQEMSILKPFHACRKIRNDLQVKAQCLLYDKVLVDAECTHDGSVFHLIKQNERNWDSLEKIINPEKLKGLQSLQRSLILNGFRLLKPGGILVYSTCSFFTDQNEDIVSWLVNTFPQEAIIEAITNVEKFPLAPSVSPTVPCANSERMIRFSPKHSNTSGLFIAKIRKIQKSKDYP